MPSGRVSVKAILATVSAREIVNVCAQCEPKALWVWLISRPKARKARGLQRLKHLQRRRGRDGQGMGCDHSNNGP
ncbi:MAG: hypothetical protein ACI81R_003142 [Bradymonadia bacterium]|jgi:hypothetical protein